MISIVLRKFFFIRKRKKAPCFQGAFAIVYLLLKKPTYRPDFYQAVTRCFLPCFHFRLVGTPSKIPVVISPFRPSIKLATASSMTAVNNRLASEIRSQNK